MIERERLLDPEIGRVGAPPGEIRLDEIWIDPPDLEIVHEVVPEALPNYTFYRRVGKLILDVGIVVALMPLWLPVYLLIAATLLVVQGRPIHHSCRRRGQGCRSYKMLKFRTMHHDADLVLAEVLATDPSLAEEYRQTAKIRNDPRVTRAGSLLRRSSLDELPQLWSVLRRDMSLVGPRSPATEEEFSRYGVLGNYIFFDKPGLTGLWQVSGRQWTSYSERMAFNLLYTQSCGFWTDLRILVLTIPAVLFGRGAY